MGNFLTIEISFIEKYFLIIIYFLKINVHTYSWIINDLKIRILHYSIALNQLGIIRILHL